MFKNLKPIVLPNLIVICSEFCPILGNGEAKMVNISKLSRFISPRAQILARVYRTVYMFHKRLLKLLRLLENDKYVTETGVNY
jgi:hypothetical protein